MEAKPGVVVSCSKNAPSVDTMRSMDPVLLSWIALGVSAASAIAAIWSVTQTWRYHPRPVWVHSFVETDLGSNEMEPRPAVHFRLENKGRGTATDLVYVVDSPGRLPITVENVATSLDHGKSERFTISLVTGDLSSTFNKETMEYVTAVGPRMRGAYRVRVQWRQSPNEAKVREKSFIHVAS